MYRRAVRVLGPILFLLYTADVLVIAARHGVSVHHSYADDTQLYPYTSAINCEATFARLIACIDDIGLWVSSNRVLQKPSCRYKVGRPHRLYPKAYVRLPAAKRKRFPRV